MNCADVRKRLLRGGAEPGAETHLSGCRGCADFSRRLGLARQALRDHHGGVEPDGRFADRVMTRIPVTPTGVMGQVAMRLLPATIALVLVLAWFVWRSPSVTPAVDEIGSSNDDLLTWVLDESLEDTP